MFTSKNLLHELHSMPSSCTNVNYKLSSDVLWPQVVSSINMLDISGNTIGDEGKRALVEAIPRVSLQQLIVDLGSGVVTLTVSDTTIELANKGLQAADVPLLSAWLTSAMARTHAYTYVTHCQAENIPSCQTTVSHIHTCYTTPACERVGCECVVCESVVCVRALRECGA